MEFGTDSGTTFERLSLMNQMSLVVAWLRTLAVSTTSRKMKARKRQPDVASDQLIRVLVARCTCHVDRSLGSESDEDMLCFSNSSSGTSLEGLGDEIMLRMPWERDGALTGRRPEREWSSVDMWYDVLCSK